ncbi:MAG: amidohydrolase family protein [Beijerinckiaceae bacterium]
MPYVDTHAHIFHRSLPMMPGRRYSPSQDCPPEMYLAQLSAHDVMLGVLVQPSFLGTDNSYMVAALDRYADRLRGIAVVDPAVSDDALAVMHETGVVGIRFNMIGRDMAALSAPDTQSLLKRVDSLGWQVEVQARGSDLPQVFNSLSIFQGPVVIDHFGLPDPSRGIGDPGFRALLSEGAKGRTFVKMSAGYRCGGQDVASCAGALLAVLGPRRLLWGSDWPFTQHEEGRTYATMVQDLVRCVPDKAARDAMDQTAMDLFGFTRSRDALAVPRRVAGA